MVKDLSYAAQQFDSTARPLGGMIDHFDAFLQTAMDVMNERAPSKKEHQSANLALRILGTEAMLQLGMVADACEIVVLLSVLWTTNASRSPNCRTTSML